MNPGLSLCDSPLVDPLNSICNVDEPIFGILRGWGDFPDSTRSTWPEHMDGGRLAQSGERLLYTQEVGGSRPSPPTISLRHRTPAV